ncbi:3-hydroxybutyrate dehydrogenase [Roseospirillum parvum]|uniref:3-hydroxybutyrate dehydrogenase n=1 Tax=Roseospirillum parvum TaxID=83401 RepID=A0A1G7WBG7_9PROT|nr:3-hydroxybutyrate dehydrogenase [Roseospirillum parvum]SDG69347.1 3-hydroxybutyrate dehydrogenase [Roseospirillum parvum]
MSLQGKSAVVTGSTSGIGLGIARALAAAGAEVMLNGFGEAAEIEALRQEMEQTHGVRVLYHPADLSQPEQAVDLVKQAESAFGKVDILVNNAGIQHVDKVEDFPPERWDQVIAINLSAAFHTTRVAVPGMKARDFGRIINIASAHGKVASVNKAAYVAAKHGIVGLTKVVALETAEQHITVNAICPGWVRTPLVEAQIEARAKQSGRPYEEEAALLLGERQPSRRFVTPEQIGAFTVFLCGPDGDGITGADLSVDGGFTTH